MRESTGLYFDSTDRLICSLSGESGLLSVTAEGIALVATGDVLVSHGTSRDGPIEGFNMGAAARVLLLLLLLLLSKNLQQTKTKKDDKISLPTKPTTNEKVKI